MKILQCHNLYQLPGGEDRVVEDEQALLRARSSQDRSSAQLALTI